MNENYLWDRTGEPDPEVRELEEILGTLRYRARALEIPDNIGLTSRGPFFVKLAIAAAIALIAIALGSWINLNRHRPAPTFQAKGNSQPAPKTNEPQFIVNHSTAAVIEKPVRRNVQTRHREPARSLVARNDYRDATTSNPILTAQQLAEKEQVLLALRLVSAKLNFAQRKTQGLPQLNPIRNHKTG
jgi:hypothetical protein